jgi:predicted CoA-binding protein
MMDNFNDEVVIRRILQQDRTIAVVGLSRRQSRAGFYVPAYLQQHGYRIIPVNPYLKEALEEKAYPDLLSIPDKVDLVQFFRQADKIPPFIDEAIEIGARSIWIQLGIINHEAAAKAQAAGMDVVMDACMLVEHRRLAGVLDLG